MAHLFVYGTLAPGQSNAHILAPLAGSWQPAAIRGKLIPEGLAVTEGFPVVIPDEHADWVSGQVFTSDDLDADWSRIDAFEGQGYERVKVQVTLATGDCLTAYVYALRQA